MDVSQTDRESVRPILCQEDGCDRPLRYVKLQICGTHYSVVHRRRKTAKGLCRNCGQKRLEDRSYCFQCLRLSQRYRYGAQIRGVCTRCRTRKPTRGKTTCSQCRRKNNTTSKSTKDLYRLEGICIYCGQRKAEKGVRTLKSENYTSCRPCKKLNRDRRRHSRVER